MKEIIPFGKFAREQGVVLRFIEFMPLEEGRVWSPEVVVTMNSTKFVDEPHKSTPPKFVEVE